MRNLKTVGKPEFGVLVKKKKKNVSIIVNCEEKEMQNFNKVKEDADSGVMNAYFKLATCYEEGLGCFKDMIDAVKWYKSAAQIGNVDAILKMANFYLLGIVVKVDVEQALEYYKLAKEKCNDVDTLKFIDSELIKYTKFKEDFKVTEILTTNLERPKEVQDAIKSLKKWEMRVFLLLKLNWVDAI